MHSGQLWSHIICSWKALTKGEDLPQLAEDKDKFNRKVSFFEAISESIAQFAIGDIIIRLYGVSDDLTTKIFQLFSLSSSMFSIMVAFVTVNR